MIFSNRSYKFINVSTFIEHNLKISIGIIIFIFGINCVIAQSSYTGHQKAEKTIQDIGDIGQFLPAAASIVAILAHKDKKGGNQFIKTTGICLGATFALKFAINKQRPNGQTDGLAFPSGHTSNAFYGASFLQRRYGWSYGIPAYLVAGFVAYSRLEGIDNRHDGWDVLGGIIIGVGSTYLFTTPYQKEHFEISFNSFNENYLIGLNYKF